MRSGYLTVPSCCWISWLPDRYSLHFRSAVLSIPESIILGLTPQVSKAIEDIYSLELSEFFLRQAFPTTIQYTVHRFVSHDHISFSLLPSILSSIRYSFVMENLHGHLNTRHSLMLSVYLNAYTTDSVKLSPCAFSEYLTALFKGMLYPGC